MTSRPTLAESLASAVNAVRFAGRSLLGVTRGPPELVDEPKADLFDHLEPKDARSAQQRERELRRRYRLEPLAARSTRLDYRENLYLLDVFERLLLGAGGAVEGGFAAVGEGPLRVVDVGSKNFAYAFALERFFGRLAGPARGVAVLGVELDGHVIYRDFRARCDHAAAYARQTENPRVGYRVDDFCRLEGERFDVATLLFPFVTRHALVRWGLPLRYFEPERLFAKAVEVTRPNGALVVLSQTEEERDRLLELLAPHPIAIVKSIPMFSQLVHYHEAAADRFATFARVG